MPKLSQTATTTVTTEIQLTLKQRQALMVKFQAYAAQKKILDATQTKMDALKAEIQKLREETGELSLELNGFQSTLVAPTRRKFDERKFVKAGGDLKIYNAAMKDVPVKSYEKISVPNSAPDNE